MDEKIMENEGLNEGFTLIELFQIIKHNLLLLIAICIAFVGLGVVYTWYIVTPMYTSTVDLQIFIEHNDTSGSDNAKAQTVVQVSNNIKAIVKYPAIIEVVIDELELEYTDKQRIIDSISSRVQSSNIGSASAVKISYTDADPVLASKIVVALAKETERRINLPRSESADSLKFASEKITIINEPIENPNQAPTSPNKILNLVISALLGGIVGLVFIIIKEQLSNTFKDKREVEEYTKLPVLSIIPTRDGGK